MPDFKLTQVEARAALVAALRSDEYAQGSGQLRIGDKFCCLGVACDVFQKLEGRGEWVKYFADEYRFDTPGHGENAILLPSLLLGWLGFFQANGAFHGYENSLAGLNDGGAVFSEIAVYIEEGKANA